VREPVVPVSQDFIEFALGIEAFYILIETVCGPYGEEPLSLMLLNWEQTGGRSGTDGELLAHLQAYTS
jgi:hypothetical protein